MQEFDTALSRALTDPAHTPEQRRKALVDWAGLPEARFAQPREEHLLPLHVVRLTYLRMWASLSALVQKTDMPQARFAQPRDSTCCRCIWCLGRVACMLNSGIYLALTAWQNVLRCTE